MKKVISLLLVFVIVTASLCTVSLASDGIEIVINGQNKVFDVMPQIINGRTMVPMRGIFEEFGAEILWEQSTRTVTAKVKDKTIILIVDNPDAKVNDTNIRLDVAAQIIDGRTMVPVRFVAEALGCEVNWNADTKTVIISGGIGGISIGNMALSTYMNDYFGIGFNLPNDWTFNTREEINEIYGIVADMTKSENLLKVLDQNDSYHDMIASNSVGENVQATINMGLGITEEEFCQQMVLSFSPQVASYGVNVKNISMVNKNIIGAKLNGVEIESEYNGVYIYQLILVKNVEDHLAMYTITTGTKANLDTIAKNFFSI